MADLTTHSYAKISSNFLHRYHLVLFTVVVLGSMAVVILLLYQTVGSSTDTTNEVTPISGTFDQDTIDKINQLQSTGGNNQAVKIPSNQRVNPFVD